MNDETRRALYSRGFVVAIIVVFAVLGVRMTIALNHMDAAVHSQCVQANQTSDVWNTLVNQGITREQKSTDSAVDKAAKIHDLEVIKFPKQNCD